MSAPPARTVLAVAGPGHAEPALLALAADLGRRAAEAGYVLVTGGRPAGVMEAASRGACSAGGTVVALLPGTDRAAATRWAGIVLPTGLGDARNALVARAGHALVAFLPGGPGTLSEVALAVKAGLPVAVLGGGEVPAALRAAPLPPHPAADAAAALAWVAAKISRSL